MLIFITELITEFIYVLHKINVAPVHISPKQLKGILKIHWI